MSDVQTYPNFHGAAASELMPGRWGYFINGNDREFTLFLCVDSNETNASARIIRFSTQGVSIGHLAGGDSVLLLDGEIEFDLSGEDNSPMSKLEGIKRGSAAFGIYGEHAVLAVAKMDPDIPDKYLCFSLSDDEIVTGLYSDAFWWKSASIRYRKDKTREWITLHSLQPSA